jgi:thioesterase domain-containing protein
MAQQLSTQGEEVAHLMVIDPLHPSYYGYFLENPLLLIGLMVQIMNPGREINLMPVETLLSLNLDQQLRRTFEYLQAENVLLPELSFDNFMQMFTIFQNNITVLVRYSAAPFSGPMTLFTVDDYPSDWRAYWEGLHQQLNVVSLHGNHYSIWVVESQVATLSRALASLLDSGAPASEMHAYAPVTASLEIFHERLH